MKETCGNSCGCNCGGSSACACACDCCTGANVITPASIWNRPGLDALAYRVGTHGSFYETMQARLSSSEFPALSDLTTRDPQDFSLALLDAWATTCDVLTFYQERFANEGYLRTATERRSVLELARLVGYRLKPGVAASVYLAYTLEPTQESVVIERDSKVQSSPGPGELPQVFETAEKLTAYASLNSLKPRLTEPQLLPFLQTVIKKTPSAAPENFALYLAGTATNLSVNQALVLTFAGAQQVLYQVMALKAEPALDRTVVTLRLRDLTKIPTVATVPNTLAEMIANLRAAANRFVAFKDFGVPANAKARTAAESLLKQLVAASDETLLEQTKQILPQLQDVFAATSQGTKAQGWLKKMLAEFNKTLAAETKVPADTAVDADLPSHAALAVTGTTQVVRDTSFDLFNPFVKTAQARAAQPASAAHLVYDSERIYSDSSSASVSFVKALYREVTLDEKAVLRYGRIFDPPSVAGVIETAEVLPRQAGLFGHNLPALKIDDGEAVHDPISFDDHLNALKGTGVIGANTTPADLKVVALDAEYQQITPGHQVVIERGGSASTFTYARVAKVDTLSLSLSKNGVTSRVTVLTLESVWPNFQSSDAKLATFTVYLPPQSSASGLVLADRPITTPINQGDTELELDSVYPELAAGRWIILEGIRIDNPAVPEGIMGRELLMIASATHEARRARDQRHTYIRFGIPPAFSYRRDTVKIYGNVVRATHGETKSEVLGSGDGSQAWQRFDLRQKPLTYLAVPTPAGAETTLELRVNDVRWHEADNFFTLAERDRKYVTKTDDDGKTSVLFGNGVNGTRLSSNPDNVSARYRVGLGEAGNVKAEQLKLLMTRPQGVKGVINPLSASGGANRETRDEARRNAPLGVLALDRLVSVQDYADFARTFTGIGKAHALRLSDGVRQVIHLSIAGADDIPIDQTSDLYRNLQGALKRFGDPYQPLVLKVYERVLLVVSAKIAVHPDYLWDKVKPQIVARLYERFGFTSRELGQDVTQSEVISALQSVAGVVYADLELLDTVDETKLKDPLLAQKLTLHPRVTAEFARLESDRKTLRPAQLVFLSPAASQSIILQEVAQ